MVAGTGVDNNAGGLSDDRTNQPDQTKHSRKCEDPLIASGGEQEAPETGSASREGTAYYADGLNADLTQTDRAADLLRSRVYAL